MPEQEPAPAPETEMETETEPEQDPDFNAIMAGLLEDPNMIEALKIPKVKAAYDDVVANGMGAGMKYVPDPVCAPIIGKVAEKMGMGEEFAMLLEMAADEVVDMELRSGLIS